MERPLPGVRRVPAARGWAWIAEAFGLFRRSPLIWIVLNLVLLGIGFALLLIPMLGPYLAYLLTPLFLAGLMTACREAERGNEIEIAHLFRGFSDNATQLVTVGGVYLVANVVIGGLAMAIGGADLQDAMRAAAAGTGGAEVQVTNRALLAVLVSAALFVPLGMAVWFAPALVVLERVPGWRALLLSLQACVVNVLPFLAYGVIMSGLFFVALLPALAGLVLWVPLAMISTYTAYRDVFTGTAPAST